MTHWKRWLCLATVALSAVFVAHAQENAELTGQVTDSTGAVVANAKVILTNPATGEVRTGTTNGAGLYDFPALHTGSYNLKVSAPSFKTYEKTNIIMNVATTVRENVVLAVGANTQTVMVQANALHLQTETNEVSNLISSEQLTQIGTNGRSMFALATLGTGVSANIPSFNGVSAQGSNESISFNGMRPGHNDWLIDGGEVYDRGSGGRPDVMPSPDVLVEFQTLDSNYAPDYGIASGGTIAMALKSGTRSFHGGAWEFNRNDDFDAGSYFSKLNHQATPELRLNIFGGAIGGPVFIPGLYPKDRSKTFFFYSEEWRRYIQGANPTAVNTMPADDIPTAGAAFTYKFPSGFKESPSTGACNEGQTAPCVPFTNDPKYVGAGGGEDVVGSGHPAVTGGLYAQDNLTPGNSFPGGVIPANLIDPNAILFMHTGAIPASNSVSSSGAPQFVASPRQPTFVREDVVRADHDISARLHLMGHFIHDEMSQTYYPDMWSSDNYPTTGNVFGNPTWGTVIKLTQTISPTLLNETSFNVNGNSISITPAGIYAQPPGWTQKGYFPAENNLLTRMPSVQLGAPLGTDWTINYWPWKNAFLNYQPRDDISWNRGRHSLKFGFAYMRSDKNQQQQADTQGDYVFGTDFSGDAYINFLLGFADSFQQLQVIDMFHWINNTYSMYGMDNWHVTPRLTLNLGLRYDTLPHVYEKFNRTANFVPSLFKTADEQIPRSDGTLDPNGPGFSNPTGAPVAFYLNGVARPGVNGFPRGLVKNDYFTWEPRLGFAYDLFGGGKTVLRGGAGIFYERVQGNDIYGTDTNPPYAYQPTAENVYFTNPSINNQTGVAAASSVFPASMGVLDEYYPNPGTAQYSLGVQHELAPAVVALVQYVGSNGWNQSDTVAINTLPLNNVADRKLVVTGVGSQKNANLYRQFPGFAGINQDQAATHFRYNSLQAALRLENKHGWTAQFAYTLAHQIDYGTDDLSSVSNPFNLKYDLGPGGYDRRNVFQANYVYRLPFFSSGSAMERSFLGGWTFSGVTSVEGGLPQNVTYGTDTLGLGGGTTNRPDLVGKAGGPKTRQEWFNTGAFAAPLAPWAGGTNNGFGTAGRNAVRGPGLFNWNMSLFKSFAITENEGTRIELRLETYNTFNHTQFNGLDLGFTDGNFGQVTSANDPRVLQFGGKFLF